MVIAISAHIGPSSDYGADVPTSSPDLDPTLEQGATLYAEEAWNNNLTDCIFAVAANPFNGTLNVEVVYPDGTRNDVPTSGELPRKKKGSDDKEGGFKTNGYVWVTDNSTLWWGVDGVTAKGIGAVAFSYSDYTDPANAFGSIYNATDNCEPLVDDADLPDGVLGVRCPFRCI